MRVSKVLRHIAPLAVLLTAAVVRAQCVTAIQPVSQQASFPSHIAGPIATDGAFVLVAKHDTTSNTPSIFTARYDGLNQVSPDRQVTTTSLNGPAALLFEDGPRQFGLFFQRTDATLMLQPLDITGSPVGAPIPMPHSWSFGDEFDITWDSAAQAFAIAHFVTGGRDLGLWLSLVAPSGSVILDTDVSLFAGNPAQPRIVALPDGTVGVLWSRTNSTPPITILTLLNGPSFNTAAVTNRTVLNPRIATDGTSMLIIFSSPKSGGGTELRYAVVNAAGSVTTADSSLMSGTGTDIAASSLIWNRALSEWALVYVDAIAGLNFFADTRLRRFTSVGATPSDTFLSPNSQFSRLAAPFPLVFVNNGYVGSIQRVISTTEGSESYLVRVCPFVASAAADYPIWRPFVPVTFTATGSGGNPGYTFQWQFGDNDSASGAVAQHVYQNPGTYTVTLTGTDSAGAKSISKITVQITTAGRQRTVRH